MILVDYREKPRDSWEVRDLIRRYKVPAETEKLPFGDFTFEGKGPDNGTLMIGVERKRLADMLRCIEDARFASHQRIGMAKMYNLSILILEGIWKPDDRDQYLYEGNGRGSFWPYKPYGRLVLYSKLRRYLFSVQLAGVIVLYSRDIVQTAIDVTELYHYFQKPWDQHSSHLEKHKLSIPTLMSRPSLTRRWAEELDGVGQKYGTAAAKFFKSPQELANSGVEEWLSIDGIGEKRAKSIVDQLEGRKG